MGFGDVVDEFLDKHSLPDTGASEETNFATTGIRSQKIYDLDTRLEHFGGSGLVNERWRVSVNGRLFYALDGTTLVNGLSNDVHDAPKRGAADWNHDGCAGVDHLLATNETFGTIHSNGPNAVLTEMRSHLEDQATATKVLNL